MRKVLSVILVLAMIYASSSFAQADSGDAAYEQTLKQLAQQYILVEVSITEDEKTTVYSGFEDFYSAVRRECPSVTDMELAWFTIAYTQCEAYSQETRALEILGVKSITSVEQYVVMGEQGDSQAYSSLDVARATTHSDVMPATDVEEDMDFGIVLFTYDLFERDTVITESGTERAYYVYARVEWLDMPLNRWTDTLGIAYTGALDDSEDIYSSVRHEGSCGFCGESFLLQETEEYNSLTGSYSATSSCLEFDFSGHAISTKIAMRPFMCNHISGDNSVDYYVPTDIYAYLGFTVLISEVGEMRVAYAHSTLGINPSLIATVSGGSVSAEFTASVQFGFETYFCAPRTLHIT